MHVTQADTALAELDVLLARPGGRRRRRLVHPVARRRPSLQRPLARRRSDLPSRRRELPQPAWCPSWTLQTRAGTVVLSAPGEPTSS
jgi:hypothetical protein